MKGPKSKTIVITFLLIIFVLSFFIIHFKPNKNKIKVLFIGIDGADWKVITPLMDDGKLPNIKLLMDKGSWGRLKSLSPLISELVWTTIATGKSQDKHGITNRLMKDPDTEEPIPPTSNLRKVKAIWNILSERKKKVGIVGYRVTWPPEKINGVMISDRADTDMYLSKDYSSPPFTDLCSESEYKSFSKVKDNIFSRIDKRNKVDDFSYFTEEYDNFLANFSVYLLGRQDFDFFSLTLIGTDMLSHLFWKYLFPEGLKITEEEMERYKDIINDYYIYCDSVVGSLLKKIDKNTVIIIASDHGFKALFREGYIFSKLDLLLELSGLNKIVKNAKDASIGEERKELFEATRYLRIYGDLLPDEFQDVREETKKILGDIKVKESNVCLFEVRRYTKNGFQLKIDLNYIKDHPEHHIIIKDKEYKISDFLSSYSLSGEHDKFGIIILAGKHISCNKLMESVTVYDITPTILYLMGLPLAKDMEGKVMAEAIDDNFLRRYPIRYIDTYEIERKEKPQKPVRSPEDEERIKERMRSLGYIN